MSSHPSFFRGKTLLIVGTETPIKRFIFQKLHKLGLQLIVLNAEKNWAAPYVHDWILGDMSQHERQITQVLAYHKTHKIDGIYNFWENDVILTSKLAEALNLVGVPVAVPRLFATSLLFGSFVLTMG